MHLICFADVFSMCLTPEQGGMMTLGGLPSNAPTPQYTPIVLPAGGTKPDFYRVEMEGALVDGVLLSGIPKKAYNENCIVDTGTPMPTLPTIACVAVARRMHAPHRVTHRALKAKKRRNKNKKRSKLSCMHAPH
jgi:hypothetical protein